MVSQTRPIDLVSKLNPEVFKLINKDVFGTTEEPLGSAQGAVTRILSPTYELMLKTLMPSILTTSPNDPNWYKKVKNYWDSFGIKVPVGGRRLETGFNFDINDSTRKDEIQKLVKTAGANSIKIETDEQLRDYVSSKVEEFDRFKFASPINVLHYLTWVFLLGHHRVAKQAQAVEKTTKIDFVLIDPKEIEDIKRTQHSLSIDATRKYLEIITDRNIVRDILYVNGVDASQLDDLDADARLKQIVDSSPKKFLSLANDKASATKARIERYCIAGVLTRFPNSSIIVDANDPAVIIGNSLDEAVIFFGSEAPDRVAKVKEFKARYQQLKIK